MLHIPLCGRWCRHPGAREGTAMCSCGQVSRWFPGTCKVVLASLASVFMCGMAYGGAAYQPGFTDLAWPRTWQQPGVYSITQNHDDGTEFNGLWYADGYTPGCDCLGRNPSECFIAGLRFGVPDLVQGQVITYARVRLAARGGAVDSHVNLLIRGVSEDSPEPFSDTRRPSQLPRTVATALWSLSETWPSPGSSLPFYHSSPDVASIVNEILARPGWGQGAEGKVLSLTVHDCGSPGGSDNYLAFEDCYMPDGRGPALLEIYPDLADVFIGKPLLGRPTDSSIIINMAALLNMDIYAEYGTEPGNYSSCTPPLLNHPAQEAAEILLSNLEPDTEYYYRIRYKEPDDTTYGAMIEGHFHTQRRPGSTFVFTVQADPQVLLYSDDEGKYAAAMRLYEQTLDNVACDNPDFHVDLGDFANVEFRTNRHVLSQQEAIDRYVFQREFVDRVCHSIPFFLVLGNHEGEQGWRAANDDDPLEVWGTLARKRMIPNPRPGGFYSGNEDSTECCGIREDYYAWVWGDGLFVVLDPFWYTTTKPHFHGDDGYPASNDGWDWTLGEAQYNWLYETLHNSSAKWKFVFSHHETGGVLSGDINAPYGHGGIESAKYKVDSRPSFEWGGEAASGNVVFGSKRPDWLHGPIHDMMVEEGVDVFFHGHDHVCVHQSLDGIIYQACPMPLDPDYTDGFYQVSGYSHGEKRNNSGHMRVSVSPDLVRVDYVRSILPEHSPLYENGDTLYNRDVSLSYSIEGAGIPAQCSGEGKARLCPNTPNPFASVTRINFHLGDPGHVTATIRDVQGRTIRKLIDGRFSAGTHTAVWDGTSECGRYAAPGVYFCRLSTQNSVDTRKILILR
jgi:hypothetical protein